MPAAALLGGASLYLVAHVLFRLRNVGSLNRPRLVTALLLPALIPLALELAGAGHAGHRHRGLLGAGDLRGGPLLGGARSHPARDRARVTHRHIRGFAGHAAEVYDRGRAPYPPELVEAMGLPHRARVLDLAAGTGLLSRALAAAGHDVEAVEPSAAMRERLPGAIEGSAEAIPLADGSVDAVVVGDAWHWFDADRAAAEVHRVLRPGGPLVLVWRWPQRRSFEGELERRLRELRDDHPGFAGEQGRDGVARHGGFSDWEHSSVSFIHRTDRDGRLALLASASFVAALPEPERDELLAQAAEQLPDGAVDLEYRAELWIARRSS